MGIGLRNMAERIEHLDGTFRVMSSSRGTTIEASLNGKHIVTAAQASPDLTE